MSDETPRSKKRTRATPTPKVAEGEVSTTGIADAEAADVEAAAETAVEAASATDATSEQGAGPAEAMPEPEPEPEPLAEPLAESPTPETPELAAASTIRVERGGIDSATAESVEVRMGGIGALQAEDVRVQWGGVGAARAERIGVEFGSVGAALAGELHVTQGFAGSVVAREATVGQGVVRTLIAQRVTVTRPTGVLVMIAARVEGEVRPVLDWRGALVAGFVIGSISAVATGPARAAVDRPSAVSRVPAWRSRTLRPPAPPLVARPIAPGAP